MRAVLALGVLLAAGCGSAHVARDSPPVPTRHYLVYDKLVGEKGIWIADTDGSNQRLLVADGTGPSLSPDGKWVAYLPNCDSSSTGCDRTDVVSTAPGATARALSVPSGWPSRWTPDSTRIVTTVADDPEDELVSADVASGKEVTLARGQFRGWSISPDGTKIVFALAHGQSSQNDVFPRVDLYVTDLDGRGDPTAITGTGDSAYPVWGPKSIAFAKLIPVQYPNPSTDFARDELWQVQADGTGRRKIGGPVPERLLKGYPHWHCIGLEPIDWSDDGTSLLAEVNCEGIGVTVAVDPQTGAVRPLGEGTFTVGLSNDARSALVQWGDERVGDENMRVLVYPYAGGKPKVIAEGAGSPSWNR